MARIFVRGLESGEYGLEAEREKIKRAPRVIKAGQRPWKDGPQHWNKDLLIPTTAPAQSMYIHLEELGPMAGSQRHAHQNEAMFYILEGKGHEIHDGKRYDWEAGDVVIVHNDCVHQHFNDDPQHPARAVVLKTKPLYMFLNLLSQRTIIPRSKEDKGYRPRDHSPDNG